MKPPIDISAAELKHALKRPAFVALMLLAGVSGNGRSQGQAQSQGPSIEETLAYLNERTPFRFSLTRGYILISVPVVYNFERSGGDCGRREDLLHRTYCAIGANTYALRFAAVATDGCPVEPGEGGTIRDCALGTIWERLVLSCNNCVQQTRADGILDLQQPRIFAFAQGLLSFHKWDVQMYRALSRLIRLAKRDPRYACTDPFGC